MSVVNTHNLGHTALDTRESNMWKESFTKEFG